MSKELVKWATTWILLTIVVWQLCLIAVRLSEIRDSIRQSVEMEWVVRGVLMGVVLSLCDRTGVMLKPWAEVGHRCIAVVSIH